MDMTCRNKQTALHLKAGAILSIMVAGSLGVAIPLVGKRLKFLRTDGNLFFVAKAFAAGVILATGFVHMLPDSQEALTNRCLTEHPWAKFQWHGFITMVASLLTRVMDFVGTEYYERKHGTATHSHGKLPGYPVMPTSNARIGSDGEDSFNDVCWENWREANGGDIESNQERRENELCLGEYMHIVGMRAHAASQSHSHADGQHGVVEQSHPHHADAEYQHVPKDASQEEISIRHVVISQVLELGIVGHSLISGISLGVSECPCTIRPLIAALVFHQSFEGCALGGCISQAGFKYSSAGITAVFFVVTTPFGICVG